MRLLTKLACIPMPLMINILTARGVLISIQSTAFMEEAQPLSGMDCRGLEQATNEGHFCLNCRTGTLVVLQNADYKAR